jgi:hypothetical protein
MQASRRHRELECSVSGCPAAGHQAGAGKQLPSHCPSSQNACPPLGRHFSAAACMRLRPPAANDSSRRRSSSSACHRDGYVRGPKLGAYFGRSGLDSERGEEPPGPLANKAGLAGS